MAERKGQGAKAKQRAGKGKASQRHLRANASAAAAAPAEPLWDQGAGRDIAGVALAVIAVASLIAVVTPATAPVTQAIAGFYHLGFGLGGYVLPFVILGCAALVFLRGAVQMPTRTVIGSSLVFVAVLGLLVLAMTPDTMVWGVTVGEADLARSGGFVGFAIASLLAAGLGKPIATVVLVGVGVAGAALVGFSISSVIGAVRDRAEHLAERRRVSVNETPWGEEPPQAPRRATRGIFSHGKEGALAQSDRALDTQRTTLIEDLDDGDDNPFVDLSAQLAAERAETTLIPIEDTYAEADSAPTALIDASRAKGRASRGQAASAAKEAPAAERAAEAPSDKSAAEPSAAETAPAIPDFLLRPTARAQATPAAGDSAPNAAPAADVDVAGEPEGRALPPATILNHNPQSAKTASSDAELAQTAESLQSTLEEFGLHSRVVGWISGPTVTTFKVQPGEGERVSRISSLEDDIALTLAAQSVRIFAPIPGTSLVGIEIPNRKRQNVNLGDVLPYVQGGPLELAIGRDAEGSPIVADLAKMPHLLIAGTTGSGKSVMINSIVVTLLMRTVPEDVRLIMVDPKRVELSGYNGLPHLYVPVVTEPKQAASALQWGVSEMERRLKVFERIGVRNIATFNAKQAAGEFEQYDNPPAKMPYLVIIIDELSDLMMVAGKDVEASIVRIAQLGRAAGIHLIVATQRPSSNVVTGLIKANITNRIAFNVATGIDSRVIIDQMGAEKLTGYGDMLFSKVDWGKPKRIQGCFVSDEEINDVVEFVKSQGEAEYHEEILSAVSPATLSTGAGGHEPADDDPLMWEAAHIVVESRLGSTSGLQRRLKVGYARAGRIMDMLEEKGIVGPPDGSKPREVLLDEEGLAELESLEARMAIEDEELGGF